jgi:predicted membrane protein DUF2306
VFLFGTGYIGKWLIGVRKQIYPVPFNHNNIDSTGIVKEPKDQLKINKLTVRKTFYSFLWIAFISFFSYKMLEIVLPYTSWEWDVDFLLTKQFIIHLDHYRIAFYSHIFSSLFVLFSGAFLFSNYILKNHPTIHRWVGKSYVALLLFISAPSGMVMAFYANGGWLAKVSFLILTPIWWWFTYKGYQTARRQQFNAHKSWMIRSYALTLSAISLRLYQMGLSSFLYIDPVTQYILVSWVSWIGNLIIAEMIIRNKQFKLKRISSLILSIDKGN